METYIELRSKINKALSNTSAQWSLGDLTCYWSYVERILDGKNITQHFVDIAKALNLSLRDVRYAYIANAVAKLDPEFFHRDFAFNQNVMKHLLHSSISSEEIKDVWTQMLKEISNQAQFAEEEMQGTATQLNFVNELYGLPEEAREEMAIFHLDQEIESLKQ